jgi:hypothetical protein
MPLSSKEAGSLGYLLMLLLFLLPRFITVLHQLQSLFPIFPFSSFFFVVFAFSFRRRLVLKERGSQERTIHTFPAGFLFFFAFPSLHILSLPLYNKHSKKQYGSGIDFH